MGKNVTIIGAGLVGSLWAVYLSRAGYKVTIYERRSDIRKAEEYNKKPPLFKKIFQAGSVEEEAMQIFMAKKKAEDMRGQLKQIITFSRGPSAWEELLKTEGEIRKKRQAMIYAQKERQRFWVEAFFGTILISGMLFLGYLFILWLMSVKGV